MKTLRLALVIFLLLACLPGPSVQAAASTIIFDDSDPNLIVISADSYVLRLLKTNGAIKGLRDRSAGVEFASDTSSMSRGECLWGVSFVNNDYVGGCSFLNTAQTKFEYQWNAATNILTLSYRYPSTADKWVNANVTITASATYFDMRIISLVNNWHVMAGSVHFPSDLLFSNSAVTTGYGTFQLPGVRIKPSFFAAPNPVEAIAVYPGTNAFADYLALDMNGGGHFAMYTINPVTNPIAPVYLGFIKDEAFNPGKFYTKHSYFVYKEHGKTWSSPVVRIRVGQTARQTIEAYRVDNQIDKYPSILQKLGSVLFQRISKAPLIKADMAYGTFSTWTQLFDRLPGSSLIHLVTYWSRGFDENYPDVLPPDPRLGTTAQMRAMVTHTQARGNLVVPYINPTWWDEESPTIQKGMPAAGLKLQDIAVLGINGMPRYETYGLHNEHGGYVVSPNHWFVKERLAKLMAQWKTEVPVDGIFEDQIGARAWAEDFNPVDPTHLRYADFWLQHTQAYAAQHLMTEMGYDRLAKTEIGFHGSLKIPFANPDDLFGAGTWEPYPLANWLFGDKVLSYQHNLALDTMTDNKPILTFNMAFGYMLSLQPRWETLGTTPDPWLNAVTLLQSEVSSRYAGAALTDFQNLALKVTRSTFAPLDGPSLSITANWDSSPYNSAPAQIAPGGFLAVTPDSSLIAGIITQFNGKALSVGDHLLVMERNSGGVTIWQPIGGDTSLTIDTPSAWKSGDPLVIRAFRADNSLIETVNAAPTNRQVTFTYQAYRRGHPVHHYRVEVVNNGFIPLISR